MPREVTGEIPNKMEDFSKRVRGRWFGELSDTVFCLAKKFLELFVNLRKSSDEFRIQNTSQIRQLTF